MKSYWIQRRRELLNFDLKREEEKLVSIENTEKENDEHKAKLAKLYDLEVTGNDGDLK